MALRIGFMGTPDFAFTALKAICEKTEHEVACVYTQPPRPKGRGHQLQKSPVHDYADRQGIPVFTPESLKPQEVQAEFAAHDLDVAVVAAYGLILPKEVLDAPRYGCLNIHASLLPRWRGASPIQHAIWAGDRESGVTIMQMDEGLDTGPEIEKRTIPIPQEATAAQLHDILAGLGAEMICETLDRLDREGPLPQAPQDESEYTYAPILKKEDGRIDWARGAAQIERQVRALNPWPGVWTTQDGKRLKILEAAFSKPQADPLGHAPGEIMNRDGDVACGDSSVLRLVKVVPEGKKPMDFHSALNGGYIKIGDVFS